MKLRDSDPKAGILRLDLCQARLGPGDPVLQRGAPLRMTGFRLPGCIMQPDDQRFEPSCVGQQSRAVVVPAVRVYRAALFAAIDHGVSVFLYRAVVSGFD